MALAAQAVSRDMVLARALRQAAAPLATAAARRFCSGPKSTRVWRWGGPAGIMGKEEDTEVSQEPAALDGFPGVSLLACGSSHSGFVSAGTLYTYGANKYGQLGRETESDDRTEPREVRFEGEGTGHVTSVSFGSFHSAAITEGGHLWTWGWGGSFWSGAGALGHGGSGSEAAPRRVEKFAAAGEEVVDVVCSQKHTLALTKDGRLFATGAGDFGRLGRGDTADEVEFEEVDYFQEARDSILRPDEPTTIVKVGAGGHYSAAMSDSGELWVWGQNDRGQLGLGEEAMGDMYSAEKYPRLVRALPQKGLKIVNFACGENHIIVLTECGALYEWGGANWLEPHEVPIPDEVKDSFVDIKALVAGDRFSLALSETGAVFSWGKKGSCLVQGADIPSTLVYPTPIQASALGHNRVVGLAASGHRCLALTDQGEYA